MGMNNEDIIPKVRTVSGVLQIGNLSFKQERQSDQAILPENTVAQKSCYLFGLNVTYFTRSILKLKLKVGRDFVTKVQNKEQVF
jgi:myosin protein heavy chain